MTGDDRTMLVSMQAHSEPTEIRSATRNSKGIFGVIQNLPCSMSHHAPLQPPTLSLPFLPPCSAGKSLDFLHHLYPWGHKVFQLLLSAAFHWETSTAKHLLVEQSPPLNTMTPEKGFQKWASCSSFTVQMDLKTPLGALVTTFDVGPGMALHQWHTGRHVTNVASPLALTCPAQVCRASPQRSAAGPWLLFASLEPYLKAAPSFP